MNWSRHYYEKALEEKPLSPEHLNFFFLSDIAGYFGNNSTELRAFLWHMQFQWGPKSNVGMDSYSVLYRKRAEHLMTIIEELGTYMEEEDVRL